MNRALWASIPRYPCGEWIINMKEIAPNRSEMDSILINLWCGRSLFFIWDAAIKNVELSIMALIPSTSPMVLIIIITEWIFFILSLSIISSSEIFLHSLSMYTAQLFFMFSVRFIILIFFLFMAWVYLTVKSLHRKKYTPGTWLSTGGDDWH